VHSETQTFTERSVSGCAHAPIDQ